MPDDAISLDLLARLCQQTLQETRATRKELADVRPLSLQTIEYARRIERRVAEQRDDLELMIKAELGGSLAHLQTRIENHLQPIEDRLRGFDQLEQRVEALEGKI
jgi:coproporphyrinogen III oxidase-like Fe-S oxidoreductase